MTPPEGSHDGDQTGDRFKSLTPSQLIDKALKADNEQDDLALLQISEELSERVQNIGDDDPDSDAVHHAFGTVSLIVDRGFTKLTRPQGDQQDT